MSPMAAFKMRWSESERGEIEEGRIQMRRLYYEIDIFKRHCNGCQNRGGNIANN